MVLRYFDNDAGGDDDHCDNDDNDDSNNDDDYTRTLTLMLPNTPVAHDINNASMYDDHYHYSYQYYHQCQDHYDHYDHYCNQYCFYMANETFDDDTPLLLTVPCRSCSLIGKVDLFCFPGPSHKAHRTLASGLYLCLCEGTGACLYEARLMRRYRRHA